MSLSMRFNLLLAAVAVCYAGLSATMWSTSSSPLGHLGRAFVVVLLCLLVGRGLRWARVLLGVFIVPFGAFALLAIGTSWSMGGRQLGLSVLMLGALGAYLALVFVPGCAAEFERRRVAARGRGAA